MVNKYKIYDIIVCVGHHKKKQGAVCPVTGITEWQINCLFSDAVRHAFIKAGFTCELIQNLSLPYKVKHINKSCGSLCLDLHCNAYNGEIVGHEVLYFYRSTKSELLAQFITDAIDLNWFRNVKPINNESGSYLLEKTRPMALIIESCFIDNWSDFSTIMTQMSVFAEQIVTGYKNYCYHQSHQILVASEYDKARYKV